MAFKFQKHLREMEWRASSGRPMKNRRPRSMVERVAGFYLPRELKLLADKTALKEQTEGTHSSGRVG